jgi:hypothetical protein
MPALVGPKGPAEVGGVETLVDTGRLMGTNACKNLRPCHQAGGELQQIQFLLGHMSVQTRERYLGMIL